MALVARGVRKIRVRLEGRMEQRDRAVLLVQRIISVTKACEQTIARKRAGRRFLLRLYPFERPDGGARRSVADELADLRDLRGQGIVSAGRIARFREYPRGAPYQHLHLGEARGILLSAVGDLADHIDGREIPIIFEQDIRIVGDEAA
ncbi:hypothetical protein WG907_06185 [Sphingobium sp. AN558]|uniref:hypothetical protein n=1 Tax=Sphingobium sp. AN558 TaxID=3133442 RepID=UPI0030C461DF